MTEQNHSLECLAAQIAEIEAQELPIMERNGGAGNLPKEDLDRWRELSAQKYALVRLVMRDSLMTAEEAYETMRLVGEYYWRVFGDEGGLSSLLGESAKLSDGLSADNAFMLLWIKTAVQVRQGLRSDPLQLSPPPGDPVQH